MKFLVTCLTDAGPRTLATGREFEAMREAIVYGGSVCEIRKAEVTCLIDATAAAELVFEQLVKHTTAIRDTEEGSLDRISSLKHVNTTEHCTAFFIEIGRASCRERV